MSDIDFEKLRATFAVAVMAGVRGQDISNALISSVTFDEFETRVEAHIAIEKQRGKS